MSNNKYTVRGLEPQNLSGRAYRMGAGAYWECNAALNQLAQLISRVTINQWAMEQDLNQWKNQMQDNSHIATQNQVIGNQKIEALKEQNLSVTQQLADQFYTPVKNQLNQLTESVVNLSKTVEQLAQTVEQMAGSVKDTKRQGRRGGPDETNCSEGDQAEERS